MNNFTKQIAAMKKFLLLFASVIFLAACSQKVKEDIIAIHTPYGTIKVKLYEKTPKHHQNFLNLVERRFFDSTLFHRVIPGFMIQAGDPDSKNAKPGQLLGEGVVGRFLLFFTIFLYFFLL